MTGGLTLVWHIFFFMGPSQFLAPPHSSEQTTIVMMPSKPSAFKSPSSPHNTDDSFVLPPSDDDNFAAVAAAASEQLGDTTPLENVRLGPTELPGGDASKLVAPFGHQSPQVTTATAHVGPTEAAAQVTQSVNHQNGRTLLQLSAAEMKKMGVPSTEDVDRTPTDAHSVASFSSEDWQSLLNDLSSTYIDAKDIDRAVSVVLGQGNNDKGMRTWINMIEQARIGADESNLDALATQVVKAFKAIGGMFYDHKMVDVDESGSKVKMYFEMSDEKAVKLTSEAFRRKYTTLNRFDVIDGRGGGGNRHEGNGVWREDIRVNKEPYNAIPKGKGRRNDKTNISRAIVARVHERGGRFLTDENSVKGMFYVVPKALPVHKTSQALREKRTKK